MFTRDPAIHMKVDTFAKLVVLDSLVEAEIGYFLEHRPPSMELLREGMVARISDLIDDIDVLDSVAAARVYDAIVDFLAELPEDPDGVVEAAVRFRRAIDRVVARGMDRRDLATATAWAAVLDELLSELADEYHLAILPDGEVRQREYIRAGSLLTHARQASDRMLWEAGVEHSEIANDMDRLAFAVRHRHLPPTGVDLMISAIQRRALRYRPSTLTRVGGFVLRQILRRDRSRDRLRRRAAERRRDGTGESTAAK